VNGLNLSLRLDWLNLVLVLPTVSWICV